MTVEVKALTTRNPHSVIFKLNRTLADPGIGLSFFDPASAQGHPIARGLFGIHGVLSVWIIGDEVQVTKDEDVRWGTINSRIIETIKSASNN